MGDSKLKRKQSPLASAADDQPMKRRMEERKREGLFFTYPSDSEDEGNEGEQTSKPRVEEKKSARVAFDEDDVEVGSEEDVATPSTDVNPAPKPVPAAKRSMAATPSTLDPKQPVNQRYKALKKRIADGRMENRKAADAEAKRLAANPGALKALERRHAVASQKLDRADAEAAGEDYERKRAWDWTIEESEKWDERLAEKERHRQNRAFQDHRHEANKVYERQLKELGDPDLERYQAKKAATLKRRLEFGILKYKEDEWGNTILVDSSGRPYDGGPIPGEFIPNDEKDDPEAVDRMVKNMEKAEEKRLQKRRGRKGNDGDEDVSHINEKNKQFNMKLKRYYDKYTTDIRENFERGTAI